MFHENVEGFDAQILTENLPHHHIYVIRASPADAGFAFIRRSRVYHVCVRKDRAVSRNMQEVYDFLAKCLLDAGCHEMKWDWLTRQVSEEHLVFEENKARKRRGLGPVSSRSPSWKYLLTPKQVSYLAAADDLWGLKHGVACADDPEFVIDLSQNPAKRPAMRSGDLPTLRKSGGLWYWPSQGRWLTDLEKGLAMGFAVAPSVAGLAGLKADTCTVAPGRNDSGRLGNAFHVASCGLVLVAGMSCLPVP